nr:uncharacterized protein LOC105330336 isoform X3 [Crassostrea gigas]
MFQPMLRLTRSEDLHKLRRFWYDEETDEAEMMMFKPLQRTFDARSEDLYRLRKYGFLGGHVEQNDRAETMMLQPIPTPFDARSEDLPTCRRNRYDEESDGADLETMMLQPIPTPFDARSEDLPTCRRNRYDEENDRAETMMLQPIPTPFDARSEDLPTCRRNRYDKESDRADLETMMLQPIPTPFDARSENLPTCRRNRYDEENDRADLETMMLQPIPTTFDARSEDLHTRRRYRYDEESDGEQRRKLTLLRSECLQEHKRDGCVEKDQTDAASRPSVEYIFRKAKHFEHFHHIYGLVRDCKTRVEKLLKNNDPAYQMPKDVTVKIGIVGHHTEDNVNLISKRPGKSQLLENQCIWGALPLVCFENESSSKSKLKENTLCQEGVCHKIFIRSDTFCDKADRDEDEDDDSIISVCQDKDQIQDIITSCLEEPLQKMLQQLRKDLKHGRFLENASDIIGEIEAISNELIPINSKDTDVPISGSKSIVPDNVKDFLYGRSDVNSFGIWNNSGFKVFVRKTTDCKELKDELIKLNKNFFQQYDLEIEKMKTEMLTLMREDNVTGALTGFVTKTNNNQKMYALTCNHLFPIENGMAYTHDFEEIGVCVFTARDKGCDFAAIEIKESYSDSCDVAFRKDDKKKTNANVYSDSLDIVHKIGATTGVTNGIIVSPYNHIFPSKNEHACTRHFENVVACVPTTKTNGCDFAAVEIKECYSNSCDVAFVKDNKKKLNANLYSNSLQTGGSVHKKEQEQIDVTNGRIVRPEFYLKATDKSNQENTFLLKGMAEKFSERGDSGSLVF